MAHDQVFHPIPSSYINVLNVYAVSRPHYRCPYSLDDLPVATQFANVHDISWVRRVTTKSAPMVATGQNKNKVEVNVPTAETDINAAYEDPIHQASESGIKTRCVYATRRLLPEL
jgi:hypothetical protein